MSWKIYNGFEILQLRDFSVLRTECLAFAAKVQPLARERLANYLVRSAVESIDRKMYYGVELPDCTMSAVWMNVQKRHAETEKRFARRDVDIDYSFSVTFFPLDGGRLLGMYFTEQDEFKNLWLQLPFVREFRYWNNTDAPKGVTDDEWEQRATTWREALPDGIASHSGFSMTLVDNFSVTPILNKDEMARILATIELDTRVRPIATDVLFKSWAEAEKIRVDAGNLFSTWREFEGFRDSDVGRAKLTTQCEQVAAKLKRDLAAEDLLETSKLLGARAGMA